MIHEGHYTNYINSGAEYKILFQTTEPVPISAFNESERVYKDIIKSYASTSQKSFEYAIVEAYEYCLRDNKAKAEYICELKMVGNYEATEVEKLYAKSLIQGNYLQVTIRNERTNDCGYNSNTMEYEWWRCQTAVRVNPDNYFKRPEPPMQKRNTI